MLLVYYYYIISLATIDRRWRVHHNSSHIEVRYVCRYKVYCLLILLWTVAPHFDVFLFVYILWYCVSCTIKMPEEDEQRSKKQSSRWWCVVNPLFIKSGAVQCSKRKVVSSTQFYSYSFFYTISVNVNIYYCRSVIGGTFY